MAADLQPCPFCGGPAELDTRQGYTYAKHGQPRHGTAVAVYCTECTVQISVCREDVPDIEPEAVIEMWNRRTPGVPASQPADWTEAATCLSELADRLEQESTDESERGNDSAACAWSCRAYELRQIVSLMVRSNAGVQGTVAWGPEHPDWKAAHGCTHECREGKHCRCDAEATAAGVDVPSRGAVRPEPFAWLNEHSKAYMQALADLVGLHYREFKGHPGTEWINREDAMRLVPALRDHGSALAAMLRKELLCAHGVQGHQSSCSKSSSNSVHTSGVPASGLGDGAERRVEAFIEKRRALDALERACDGVKDVQVRLAIRDAFTDALGVSCNGSHTFAPPDADTAGGNDGR